MAYEILFLYSYALFCISNALLQFMQEKTAEAQVKTCSKVPSKVKRELHTLIRKEIQDNQSVIDWIECNVDKSCKSSTFFVNYLTTSVCWNSTENGMCD